MAYTQIELETMLAEVKAAISKTLTAQEYQAGAGMSVRRAMLRDLHERERWLMEQLAEFSQVGTAFDPANRVEFTTPE